MNERGQDRQQIQEATEESANQQTGASNNKKLALWLHKKNKNQQRRMQNCSCMVGIRILDTCDPAHIMRKNDYHARGRIIGHINANNRNQGRIVDNSYK